MITRNALRAIALATSCLAPMAAFAQAPATMGAASPAISIGGTPVSGELELGLAGLFGRNPDQFGRYNGLNTTGLDLEGNFSLVGRDAWNSGGTRYYELEGDRLVFQTGNNFGSGAGNSNGFANSTSNSIGNEAFLGIKAGDQGTWGISGYYNAITYTGNVIDSIYTVNGSQAYLNRGLTPWGGATLTSAGPITSLTVPQVLASGALLPVQIGTRRDILGGNFNYRWGDWTFTGAFRHEHKEGSLEETYDGLDGGMAFALPVDYDTDRYDASAAYNSRLYQGVLQYTFSHFTDNNLFVNLPYPTSNTAQPYQRSAAYSLPPSNSAHYVTVMLATNAIPETRINLNARVGIEKQDDTFAPNTADPYAPTLAATNTAGFLNLNPMLQGTSHDSPDITATVYQVKLSANSHPILNTDINAFYGIDGRSVKLNQYGVYGSGTGSDASPSSATPYAFVVPQDWLKQNAGVEVTYKVLPQYNTRLTAGYRIDITDRSNAQVGHSWTNTATAGIASNIGPQLDGRLTFDYTDRSGNMTYFGPWYFLGQGVAYSGAYYQAPMTAEGMTARADYQPSDKIGADFFVRFKNENYNYASATALTTTSISGVTSTSAPPLTGVGGGVKQDYALSLGPDVTYRPRSNLTFHAFYTYELLFYNNIGNGACSTAAQAATAACAGTAGYFQNKDTSSTHTFGISGEWKVNPKLKIKADYTLSYGTVMFGEFNGVFVANPTISNQNVTNYPDIDSLMNAVQITVTYQLRENVELVGQGAYVSFHSNNWNDSASPVQGAGSTAISIFTPGYGSPTYNIGMLMGAMRIKF